MQGLRTASRILTIIGALSWGLVGLFNWNLVEAIFGGSATHAEHGEPYHLHPSGHSGVVPLGYAGHTERTDKGGRVDKIGQR